MPALSRTVDSIRQGVFAALQPRIDEAAARGVDLIPLQIGDTCLLPPRDAWFSNVVARERPRDGDGVRGGDRGGDGAGAGDVDVDLYRYGATAGTLPLRRAIAARFERNTGLRVDGAREVLVGVGATHAIACAIASIVDPGDEVILASPYWPLAHGLLSSAGARVVEVPLTQRLYEDPTLDVEAIFTAAVTPKTRALYVITPNNPDGYVLRRAHLEAIARVAIAHDLWVLSDEVNSDAVYEGEHVPLATIAGMGPRTITAGSLSKTHAMAGARIGHVIAPEPVIVAARKVSTHSVFNVPVIAQRAAVAALEAGARGDAWSEETRAHGRRARDAMVRALEGSGVKAHVADGSWYLFADFAPVLAGRPMQQLLEAAIDHGVLVAPGEAFGRGHETFARLCFTGVPIARVVEGIARLRRAIESGG